jgi:hypothetical protein
LVEHNKRTGRGSRQFHSELPPFVPLMKALLLDPTISATAKVTWAFVVEASWQDNRDQWDEAGITHEQFAAALGFTAPTVRKAVKDLVETGWLSTWKRGQGLANGYQANAKPQVQDERNFQGTLKESSPPRARASTEGPLEERIEDTGGALATRTRKRDIVFDAMAEATDSDPNLEGARVGTAIAKLRKHPGYQEYVERHGKEAADLLLATEIQRRANAFRERWPELTLTPTGLVSNWRRLVEQQQRPTPLQEAEEALRREREENER